MSTYSVTIKPDSGTPTMQAIQVVFRVDTGAHRPRIVEMRTHSSAPDGLIAAQVSAIDLQGVVDALQSGVGFAANMSAVEGQHLRTTEAELGSVRSDQELVENRSRDRIDRSGAAVGSATAIRGGRAYRRMPDVDDLRAAYQRIGTVTGVAKHYDVPRHTAQGWLARLRKLQSTSGQQDAQAFSSTSHES
jgi:hypothetical protein